MRPNAALRLALTLLIAACCVLTACGEGNGESGGVQPASVGPADLPLGPPPSDPNAETFVGPPFPGDEEEPHEEMVLFFADEDGYPEPELREVPLAATLSQRVRRLVDEMAAGPASADLYPVLPPDAALREFYLTADGMGYLDMNVAFETGLSSGSEDAIMAVRCLTDAVAATFPEVETIKILVEGEEPREFGGHLDLSHPIAPDPRVEPPDPGSGLPR